MRRIDLKKKKKNKKKNKKKRKKKKEEEEEKIIRVETKQRRSGRKKGQSTNGQTVRVVSNGHETTVEELLDADPPCLRQRARPSAARE